MKVLLRTIKILNQIPNQRTSFGSTYEIIPELEKLKLSIAKKEWQKLSEIAVDEDGQLMDNYTVYQETEDEYTYLAGTHQEEIWSWFEEEFNISVHDDLMFHNNQKTS